VPKEALVGGTWKGVSTGVGVACKRVARWDSERRGQLVPGMGRAPGRLYHRGVIWYRYLV